MMVGERTLFEKRGSLAFIFLTFCCFSGILNDSAMKENAQLLPFREPPGGARRQAKAEPLAPEHPARAGGGADIPHRGGLKNQASKVVPRNEPFRLC